MHNKEIQDHLLGEIKETDNSVRALYKAWKNESKLAQRQMLGIVIPSTLVSVDAVKKNSARQKAEKYVIVIIVDIPMGSVSIQHLENCAIDVVRKTTLRKNVDPVRDLTPSQDVTQEGQIGPKEKVVNTSAVYLKFARKTCEDNSVNDLVDQVQSLFYN